MCLLDRATPGTCRPGNIHWLHLKPKTLKWPQRYFERHGAKAVFIVRFIAILPPMAANLMAGMTKIRWRVFLLYDLAGSVAFATSYILIGYVVGKQWKLLENGWAPWCFT
jgi:membrane protein DedA with SNARE-associated domain